MITTGIGKLDKLLGGGIRGGVITDIYGPSGSGKTQLLLQICVNSLAHDGVIKIIVGRITNTSEQLSYVDKILEIENLNLVVIDNVTDLFSFEYSKESNSLAKHIAFMEYMHKLAHVTVKRQIPVIVTNITRKSDDEERESLDRSISMFTHQKIKLEKIGQKYAMQVFPSFDGKKMTDYTITQTGLEDSP